MKLEKKALENALRTSISMLEDAELTASLMHNQIAYLNKRLNRIKVEEEQKKNKETTSQSKEQITTMPATSEKI